MMSPPVRVAVVAAREQRALLLAALGAEGTLVVGQTGRADRAAELVAGSDADVVVIDLGLGGGLRAITEIMTFTPKPVLALVPPGNVEIDAALAAGAVEAYPRPSSEDPRTSDWLRERVRSLRRVSILPRPETGPQTGFQRPARSPGRARRGDHPAAAEHPAGSSLEDGGAEPRPLVAVAGTPSAVGGVLSGLRGLEVPLVASVRLAPELLDGYTAFLSRLASRQVERAVPGAIVRPGAVRVASADRAVTVDSNLRVRRAADAAHAADELFASVARVAGSAGVGVLLAGTGGDGPSGLRALLRAGGITIVQDTAATTSTNLPDVRVLPLARIAAAVRAATTRPGQ
jgi:two-component system chemotaxis response regulator CheB